jgi:hypothetical protein
VSLDPGVVYEQAEPPPLAGNRGDGGLDASTVADVHLDELDARPGRVLAVTAASTRARSRTSISTNSTRVPGVFPGWSPAATTCQPSASSRAEIAQPMPCSPPVTIATLGSVIASTIVGAGR